jgi:transcriptional regulator with XRE-family HTH domain
MERGELASRAAISSGRIARYEGAEAEEPKLTTALKLAHSLGASIDQLTDGIYWTPGQILRGTENPVPAERLMGFFEVLPTNVPAFEPAPRRDPIGSRDDVARIFGSNVRDARERRHLSQQALGGAAGLSKSGLSLIERGVHETTIEVLLALARALEVPPNVLLDGIAWNSNPTSWSHSMRSSLARRPAGIHDDAICRLWNEGMKTREIAEKLGTSPGSVSAIVHKLRERGAQVGYRRPPTRAIHERTRRRRQSCVRTQPEASENEPQKEVKEVGGLEPASRKDIAAQIGVNVARYRERTGLPLRSLKEATEIYFSALYRIENARSGVPKVALILKLAGGLNVRCSLLTAGVKWDVESQSFRIEDTPPAPPALAVLGQNATSARRRIDLSQQALSDRASLSRGDVVDFERGSRNFRLFTIVRLAGTLEIGFADLFAGVGTWHVRPLAPPEFLPGERPGKAERDQLLIRLWNEGRPETEIADALGLSRNAVAPYVRELRDAGEHLPHRRPPRSTVEAAARRRRDHSKTSRLQQRARLPASP